MKMIFYILSTYSRYLIIILIALSFLIQSIAQESLSSVNDQKVTPQDIELLLGEWTGTLTYIDYSSGEPYTMPADVIVEKGKTANQLVLRNSFPNEPKANNKDKLKLSKNGDELNGNKVTSRMILPSGELQIKTEYIGKDNRKKATIQNVITIGAKRFVRTKNVQFENSEEWLKRSEFSYKKKSS